MKQASKLHLLLAPFAGASAWFFRMAYETPNPVAPYVGGGVLFAVACGVACCLKIDRECIADAAARKLHRDGGDLV